jgi:hypothetical protein
MEQAIASQTVSRDGAGRFNQRSTAWAQGSLACTVRSSSMCVITPQATLAPRVSRIFSNHRTTDITAYACGINRDLYSAHEVWTANFETRLTLHDVSAAKPLALQRNGRGGGRGELQKHFRRWF